MKKLSFILLLGLFGASLSWATTNNVACNASAIQAAIAAVNEGDTIVIGAGTCVLPSTTAPNGISFNLLGSGTNSTFIIAQTGRMLTFNYGSANETAVGNFTLIGTNATDSTGIIQFGSPSQDSPGPYRAFSMVVTNLQGRGISMGLGSSKSSMGVIDHCIFLNSASGTPQPIDYEGAALGSWTNANSLATTNVVDVEDCYFKANGNGGNGFFDHYNGAQAVFRHNFCDGYAPSGNHGYDSGFSSGKSWEVHDNIFTNANGGTLLQWRGGAGVVYNNLVYGTGIELTHLDYYRSCLFNHSYIAQRSVPGQGLDINFNNTPGNGGYSAYFNGQPANNATIDIGFSTYRFKTSYYDQPGGYSYPDGVVADVVIGATVAATITNLYNCVNSGPGRGTTYANGSNLGFDMQAFAKSATDLYLTNTLDCNTNAFGYPAFQQPGTIGAFTHGSASSNTNFVQHATKWPCYSWSNYVNGVSVGFTVSDNTSDCNYYITNLVQLNRDYFTNTIPAPGVYDTNGLAYPNPLVAGGGGTTYTVAYNGNGNTGGTAPTDGSSPYASGSPVTVLDNSGALAKSGSHFVKWNTATDGSGQDYFPASQFIIGGNATLYAQYIADAGQFRPVQFRRSRGGLQ